MPLLTLCVNGFWKRTHRSQGEGFCLSVLNQARTPLFYERWNIPDTLEGRFDCAVLHMALLLRYLKGPLGQAVFDAFFSYTELTLREEGVSDLTVGKQVKKCAKFFYGALKAYHEALDHKLSLEEALSRNLYGTPSLPFLREIAEYVKACDVLLRRQDFERAKSIEWPLLEENKEKLSLDQGQHSV
jgi:cytochrome b pre-mRNA-processing protein 3